MSDIPSAGSGRHRHLSSGALGRPAVKRAVIKRPQSQRITYIRGTKDNILNHLQKNCSASQMSAANKAIQDNDVVRMAENNCIIINRDGIKGKIILSPKGSVKEKYPDGSATTTMLNGSKVHTSSEGRKYILKHDGEVIPIRPSQELPRTGSAELQRAASKAQHAKIREDVGNNVQLSQDTVSRYKTMQTKAGSGHREPFLKTAPKTSNKNKLFDYAKKIFSVFLKKWSPHLSKITR